MQPCLKPREIQILKALSDVPEPINVIDLAVRIHYFATENIRIYLQRLENFGYIHERKPWQRKSVRLTEKGKEVASHLSEVAQAA